MTTDLPVYDRDPISFDYGKGAWLWDSDGNKYLDFSAGIAVNCLGHSNHELITALTKQANKLWHVSNAFTIPQQTTVADKLVHNTFADYVFFCNSGSESNECAFKLALNYQESLGQPQRKKIISFYGAFHGRTIATSQASGRIINPALNPWFIQAEPAKDTISKAIDDETAAIIIEPIQGEGGVTAFTTDFLQYIRHLCDQHNLVLIFDEVQTGIGRTGTLYNYMQHGLIPDILTSAKGLGGGFPLAACLISRKIGDVVPKAYHGSTFGGNPLAMSAANAVLDIILSKNFMADIKDKAEYFATKISQLIGQHPKTLIEIRGNGLMRGIKIDDSLAVSKLVRLLRQNGLLTVKSANNVLRLLPPLIISKDEIEMAINKIATTIEHLNQDACLAVR